MTGPLAVHSLTAAADPQVVVDAWNATHPVGAAIRYWPGIRPGGRVLVGETVGPAWLCCGTPVVPARCPDRHRDAIALSHVEVIAETEVPA